MKKSIALILAVAMLMIACVACGGNTADKNLPADETRLQEGSMFTVKGGEIVKVLMQGKKTEGGENGGTDFGFGNFLTGAETKEVDISKAHISVEIDGGKASGSMEDLRPGVTVTITLNSKGQATYVLVSSQSFFGGGRRPGN